MKQIRCHKIVRDVAMSAAHELYDALMHDNVLAAEWKRVNPGLSPRELEARFVMLNWPRCVDFARATLALMLRGPLDTRAKESIVEALVLDASLRPTRAQVEAELKRRMN